MCLCTGYRYMSGAKALTIRSVALDSSVQFILSDPVISVCSTVVENLEFSVHLPEWSLSRSVQVSALTVSSCYQ